MSKQDTLKKENPVETVQRVKLMKILQNQTFYHTDNEGEKTTLDIGMSSASDFDAWACLFVDSIVNVARDIWDAFARWKFINTLLGERILAMIEESDGTIMLRKTEVFSSVSSSDLEEKTSVEPALEPSI